MSFPPIFAHFLDIFLEYAGLKNIFKLAHKPPPEG